MMHAAWLSPFSSSETVRKHEVGCSVEDITKQFNVAMPPCNSFPFLHVRRPSDAESLPILTHSYDKAEE
jgi:hypothetical protein